MPARLHGAVFGLGHMGKLHARKLEARGDVKLTCIDPPRGLEAPAGARFDFAIIASPTTTHHTVAGPLLERGVPCLVEKPLAADLDQARQLAVYEHLTVGHIERFNPALEPVAHVRPRFIQAERLSPYGARKPGMRGTDVDVVADLMIHDLDLVMSLLEAPTREVRAIGVGVMGGPADIANARIERGTGVAVLTASRVSRQPVRKLRLVEEEGVYWSIDLLARTCLRVRWGSGALDGEPVPVPSGDQIEREHQAFLAAVRGERAFPVPGHEAVAAMELAAAVRTELSRGAFDTPTPAPR